MRQAAASRDPQRLGAGAHDSADPVPAASGQVRYGGTGRYRELTLVAVRSAEIQTGRQVDSQPGLQFPVGDGIANMRFGGASGDRPVHPADVVTGLVVPRLPRLGARPRYQSEVIALQQPVQPAPYGELQRAEAGLHATLA